MKIDKIKGNALTRHKSLRKSFDSHTLAMSRSRQLPERSARSIAVRRLEGFEDAEDTIHHDIEDDDVAQMHPDVIEEEVMEDGDEIDEIVEEAEDWAFHESIDGSEEEDDDVNLEEEELTSSDGTRWSCTAERAGRRPALNILTQRMGFQPGLHPSTRKDAFLTVFDSIVDTTVIYTNLAGRRLAARKGFVWKKTDRVEMEAFLGLHILAGALKAHHRSLRELYCIRDGIALFRATMSEKRFEVLKACLRFDDPLRRESGDRGAPVRQMINSYNNRLQALYTPGPHLTIDEMLIEFHGRVSFKQYIPSKPGKFGLKMYWITEAETAFPLQCILYTGRDTISETAALENGGRIPALVINLLSPYLDSGRNLTSDNWFTSKTLAERLVDRRTTLVGTVKSRSRFVPNAARSLNNRVRGDTLHLYTNNSTLCSFWDKGKKTVILLSTMHGHQRNLSAVDGKGEIVKFYNSTKSGVDTLDKLVRGYSSKRKYRRWPCHVFFCLVDCAVYVSFLMSTYTSDCHESHLDWKKELAYELTLPFVHRRSQLQGLRSTVKIAMDMVGVSTCGNNDSAINREKGRCSVCPRKRDRKTKASCRLCYKFLCGEHQVPVCNECVSRVSI